MAARKTSRVNRKYKTRYRIQNWPAYERGLKARGDVTIISFQRKNVFSTRACCRYPDSFSHARRPISSIRSRYEFLCDQAPSAFLSGAAHRRGGTTTTTSLIPPPATWS